MLTDGKVSAVFVPVVIGLAVVTFIIWFALCLSGAVSKDIIHEEYNSTLLSLFGD